MTTKVYLETWEQTLAAPMAFPEKVKLIERREFDLDTDRCLMTFDYVKRVGFPAIEKELKRIGAMTDLPEGQGYWFGLVTSEPKKVPSLASLVEKHGMIIGTEEEIYCER